MTGKRFFFVKKQRASIIIGCIERQKQLRELVSTQKRENISKLYMTYSDRGNNSRHSNFFTYVDRAEKEFGTDEDIRRDLKNPMGKIKKALEKH